MRQRGQILHLNKYLHPTHYINNMTFTIYNNKRFVLKEEHFSLGMLFLVCFFLQRGYNCNSFSICPFYYQKYYCAAGWMVARTDALTLLARSPGSPGKRRRRSDLKSQICSTEKGYYCWPLLQRQLDRFCSEKPMVILYPLHKH